MATRRLVAAAFMALALAFCESLTVSHGAEVKACSKCSMELAGYGHSKVEVGESGGGSEVFCSLACAVSAADPDTAPPASFRVADYDTHELIDAGKAVWVVGGSVVGVMTPRAKWAFEDRARAERFVSAHGGEIGDWRFAVAAAREDERKSAEEARSFFDK